MYEQNLGNVFWSDFSKILCMSIFKGLEKVTRMLESLWYDAGFSKEVKLMKKYLLDNGSLIGGIDCFPKKSTF